MKFNLKSRKKNQIVPLIQHGVSVSCMSFQLVKIKENCDEKFQFKSNSICRMRQLFKLVKKWVGESRWTTIGAALNCDFKHSFLLYITIFLSILIGFNWRKCHWESITQIKSIEAFLILSFKFIHSLQLAAALLMLDFQCAL